MPTPRKERKQYVESVQRIAGKYEQKPGWVGASPSQIQSPIPDLIYVRLVNRQVVLAVNKLAPLIYNFPIVIARNSNNTHWEVVEIRQPYGGTNLEQTKDHHLQHEYPSRDTVWVRGEQFTPLLVLPSSGFEVAIYGGIVRQTGVFYAIDSQVLDLSSYQPSSGAVWAMLEVLEGEISVTLSDTYPNKEALLPSNVPIPTGLGLCAIRLYNGQASLTRNNTVNDDFVDLRFGVGGAVDSVNGETGVVDLYAADIPITDSGGYFTGTEVEAALQELGANSRERLTEDREYFIRTDGSDSNDGLTNSSGGAFATFDKAWDTLLTLDTAGFTVTIKYGNSGTYTDQILIDRSWSGGGEVVIEGDVTTPSNIILSITNALNIKTTLPAPLTFKGFRLTGNSAITQNGVGVLYYESVDFSGGGHHVQANTPGAKVQVIGNYTISAGGVRHYLFTRGAVLFMNNNVTVSLSGTPAFSAAFAVCGDVAVIRYFAGANYSGSATGQRYSVTTNGVILPPTNVVLSETFLPGDSNGEFKSGGQYGSQDFVSTVTSQFDKTSSTSFSSITGLSQTMLAGRTYKFKLTLFTTSNAAGGIKFDFNGGTATVTSIIAEGYIKQAGVDVSPGTSRVTALATTFCNVTAVTAGTVIVEGYIIVNAAGTFVPRFAQNASNGIASSVLIGSSMIVEDI
jgi:hypothetical protein